MYIQAVTLFPQMFVSLTDYGVIGRALKRGVWAFSTVNPRQFADNRLGYVDDQPFGGGPGAVLEVGPLVRAYRAARSTTTGNPRGIYLSPQGVPLNQARVRELAQEKELILICGRYEGIDERFLSITKVEEISVGDFVVSGGELPAMILIDSVLRCLPGILGDINSAHQDSFENGLLDYPHYTRPVEFEGHTVPNVLLSGHHDRIRRWRLRQSLARTLRRRPDLLDNRINNPEETCLLQEILRELQVGSILE